MINFYLIINDTYPPPLSGTPFQGRAAFRCPPEGCPPEARILCLFLCSERRPHWPYLLRFEPMAGIEPATSSLPRMRSTPELHRQSFSVRAEDEAQTRDPQLGRLMLYQLSYFRRTSGWEEVDSNHRTRRSGFTVRRNCHYAIFPFRMLKNSLLNVLCLCLNCNIKSQKRCKITHNF